MKVLVLGGSGYLGQFVVDHFLKTGHAVLFTHSKELPAEVTASTCSGGQLTSLRVDLTTEGALTALEERAQEMGCGVSKPAYCHNFPRRRL